jgi:hypothetical protein
MNFFGGGGSGSTQQNNDALRQAKIETEVLSEMFSK